MWLHLVTAYAVLQQSFAPSMNVSEHSSDFGLKRSTVLSASTSQ